MAKAKYIELSHVPMALYKVEYMPSYDLYFVKRSSDEEIVLQTSYRSEAMLYAGIHEMQ